MCYDESIHEYSLTPSKFAPMHAGTYPTVYHEQWVIVRTAFAAKLRLQMSTLLVERSRKLLCYGSR